MLGIIQFSLVLSKHGTWGEIFKLLSSESCLVCDTEMGGGGHVLCRALRNTCSLADSAQHYSNSTKHSLADALINDACSPCLTLWCFHVTAWGRGMFQVKKTMTMLPNKIPYVPGDIWHCTPTLDLGRPASQNVTSADSLNTRFWYLWHCNTSEQRTRDGQYLARKCCGPWNSHSFGGEENTITRQWQHMATLGTVSPGARCHSFLHINSERHSPILVTASLITVFMAHVSDLSCVSVSHLHHLRPCQPGPVSPLDHGPANNNTPRVPLSAQLIPNIFHPEHCEMPAGGIQVSEAI